MLQSIERMANLAQRNTGHHPAHGPWSALGGHHRTSERDILSESATPTARDGSDLRENGSRLRPLRRRNPIERGHAAWSDSRYKDSRVEYFIVICAIVAQGRGLVVVRPVSYGIEIRATSARLGSVCRARALCARLLHRRGLIGTLGNFRLSSARPYRASATPGRAASLYPILLEYHERH